MQTRQKRSSRDKAQEPAQSVFFLVAALAIYLDEEGNQKQRHVNVLLENSAPMLTKDDLNSANQAVLKRVNAENGVTPDRIKDIVLLTVSPLGVMAPEVFYGTHAAAKDLDPSLTGRA